LPIADNYNKRRFKSDLSVDMISPPLADFRHTMHVGRGGDVFGDTSFLSNYGAREPGSPDSANSSRTTGFFTLSPIIKNAVSLPQLNIDPTNGRLERVLFPTSISSADDSFCTYGEIIQIITCSSGKHLNNRIIAVSECISGYANEWCLATPTSGSFGCLKGAVRNFQIPPSPSLPAALLPCLQSPSLRGANKLMLAREQHHSNITCTVKSILLQHFSLSMCTLQSSSSSSSATTVSLTAAHTEAAVRALLWHSRPWKGTGTVSTAVRQSIKHNPGSDWFFLLGRDAFWQSAKGSRSSRGDSMSLFFLHKLLV
uniref:Cdc42 effector protein 1-like n=1 Tax=Gouania willdenowi TaxID=441366 RepID=A0A8C5D5L9_GOUWI